MTLPGISTSAWTSSLVTSSSSWSSCGWSRNSSASSLANVSRLSNSKQISCQFYLSWIHVQTSTHFGLGCPDPVNVMGYFGVHAWEVGHGAAPAPGHHPAEGLEVWSTSQGSSRVTLWVSKSEWCPQHANHDHLTWQESWFSSPAQSMVVMMAFSP